VDVLMGHVCVQNNAWDEAKHYLNRALETFAPIEMVANAASQLSRRPSSALVVMSTKGGCFSLREQMKCVGSPAPRDVGDSSDASPSSLPQMKDSYLRDPLADAQSEPASEAKSYAALAKALLKRIDDLQQTHQRMVASVKAYSIKQTASRN
jgi:hypothetical protein